jgi:23S rRNA pseudouridine2605 synthase
MTKKKIKPEATATEATEPKLEATPEAAIEAKVETAAEAVFASEVEAAAEEELVAEEAEAQAEDEAETETEAEDGPEPEDEDSAGSEGDAVFIPQPRPPAKLERLQKILAAAGVSSRRRAEELIEQGRVQVNGKIVTLLGTKGDAARDHIRVDGKLLQGPERLRYFVLNKPRGFVTTVKDPEGRPTVMQFFEKMKERLYPVGRLDYLSEGLLVVTNDGELANRLTKASSGVEKTYLVKVAGQPTEAELDILRGGVSIALGAPGSRQIRTSPARIRQVRQGDNPWYEVVLIEGRNRELRKMFEEIGHFVEKIRRTGYGPLVLDQEPGNLRELQPEELAALRLTAEGKLRTPKSKDLRRRNLLDAGLLPTVLPKPSGRPRTATPLAQPPDLAARPSSFRPKKFGADRPARSADSFASGDANKFFRPARPSAEGFRPAAGRTSAPNPVRSFSRTEEERPSRTGTGSTTSFGFNRPAGRSFDRPDSRPAARPAARSAWKKDDRPARPPARFAEGATGEARPASIRPAAGRPAAYDRPRTGSTRPGPAGSSADRPFTPKPAWKKPDRPARQERPARPDFKRSAPPRREAPAREARVFDEDLGPVRPPNLHIEEITGPDRSSAPRPSPSRSSAPRASYSRPGSSPSAASRPSAPRSYSDRPGSDRPRPSRPSFDRPTSSTRPSSPRPRPDRPAGDRPSSSRSSFDRPARAEGTRPYTTSSGKPRAGGARPSSKPGSFAKAGPGWKPKSSFSPGKPASGSRSKPKPGSSAKPSHRVKPGGKRPTGKPAGKKRNY